jgi:hypothetical protein
MARALLMVEAFGGAFAQVRKQPGAVCDALAELDLEQVV